MHPEPLHSNPAAPPARNHLTIREAWALGREHLLASGIHAAGLEAEVLLCHVLGLSRTGLYLSWEQTLAPEIWQRYQGLLEERSTGRPVAYLTGHREFMGLDLLVDERVLIPRPETELLVEFVLEVLKGLAAPRILDVGTGSGAVAIALAHFLPGAHVLAVDISSDALTVARANVERLGLAGRILLVEGDLLEPARAQGWRDCDVIASNPPYVDPEAARVLPREITEHEPRLAVVDPGGGTTFHARLAAEAPELLRKGSWLAVEVAAGQAPEVVELFRRTRAYRQIRVLQDLQGIERVVSGETA